MRALRFYFCDDQGRIVRAQNLACDDDEAKGLAADFLARFDDRIDMVEVWRARHLLHRVARHDPSG